MREIANAAEVSYQTLYNYFPTKASIAKALLASDVAKLAERVSQIISSYDGSLLTTLAAVNRTRLLFFVEHDRALWRDVCIDLFNDDSDANQLYQLVDQAAHLRLEQLLSIAQEQGELAASVDIALMAHSIFCLSEYAMMDHLMNASSQIEAAIQMINAQLDQLVAPHLSKG